MITHDQRSTPENTECVEGAPHVHFHHMTSDMSVGQGKPCAVELCCHACHESAVILFRPNPASESYAPFREKEVLAKRDEFVQAHARCKPESSVDFHFLCAKERAGQPKVFDYSGALS